MTVMVDMTNLQYGSVLKLNLKNKAMPTTTPLGYPASHYPSELDAILLALQSAVNDGGQEVILRGNLKESTVETLKNLGYSCSFDQNKSLVTIQFA